MAIGNNIASTWIGGQLLTLDVLCSAEAILSIGRGPVNQPVKSLR